MLAQEIDYYAEIDFHRNYKALELAIDRDIDVELALIAYRFRNLPGEEKPKADRDYNRHNYTLSDALEMAQMRRDKIGYDAIGVRFGTTGSHVYIILKKHGLLELGQTKRGRAYR